MCSSAYVKGCGIFSYTNVWHKARDTSTEDTTRGGQDTYWSISTGDWFLRRCVTHHKCLGGIHSFIAHWVLQEISQKIRRLWNSPKVTNTKVVKWWEGATWHTFTPGLRALQLLDASWSNAPESKGWIASSVCSQALLLMTWLCVEAETGLTPTLNTWS